MSENPWITHSSKVVYQNPWIKVREDDVTCPDGSKGIYGVVEPPIATGVIAINEKNEVYLVGQFRYPNQNYSWEIIEGGAKLSESPLDAAKRELTEEAGLLATEWIELGGVIHTSNCITTEKAYMYLARGLTEVTKNPDSTEILELKVLPFNDVVKMVENSEIQDAISIVAIYRAQKHIKYNDR